MDDIHEDHESLGTNRFPVRHVLGKSAQTESKDYSDPPPAPLFEFKSWSFWRAGVAELIATILLLYITVLTVMRVLSAPGKCAAVGIQGSAWAFGGMIFARLLHCRCFRHISPAVTFGLFLARKLSLTRAIYYIIMQCLGTICGPAVVKGYNKVQYNVLGGGDNVVNPGCSKGDSLGAEIVGTFVLVYTVFLATDAKRSARDSHVPMLAPLPIQFVVFLVLLASISITGTGINSTRSLGTAIIYNNGQAWEDHVGPFIGATLAALYHRIVIRAIPFKNKA